MKALLWLRANPTRGEVLNVLMLVLLLVVIETPAVLEIAGSAVIATFALLGLKNASQMAMAERRRGVRLLDQLLTWLPGAVALCLAIVGLHLVIADGENSAAGRLGVLLFAFELVVLAVVTGDLARPVRRGASGETF